MRRTLITVFIACMLIAISGVFAFYKHHHYQFPLLPSDTFKSWYVELSASLIHQDHHDKAGLELTLVKPVDQPALAIANPQLLARDFGIREKSGRYKLNKRNPDRKESFLYRFSLYKLDVNEKEASSPEEDVSSPYHPSNRISNPDETSALLYEEIDRLSGEAMAKSSSTISFANHLIDALRADEETARFLQQNTDSRDLVSLAVHLLRANDITARAANGLPLRKEATAKSFIRWIEVYEDQSWHRFFVDISQETQKRETYLTWWYGDTPLIAAPQHYRVEQTVALKANNDGAFTRSLWLSQQQNSLAYDIALQTLPLQQQLILQVLLLLPLGALIVSFFRQVIGVQTFGTFMPVLIALAFRETGLFYGVCFFLGIISIGLIARHYVDRLQLLMVPRLSAILCVVVMFLVLFMLLNKEQTIPLGISVALFPVVIIVMFIERMSTIMDEQGVRPAIIGCGGSVLVACLIYLCTMNPVVQHIVFTFPEHLLAVLGLCLMIGRYNGFKLTEYWRFYQLHQRMKQSSADSGTG